MSGPPAAPPGYESFFVGRARVVATQPLAGAVRQALAGASLHQWAARQPGARAMQGRATAWATKLANGVEVVVRHSRHGGLFAPLTGDRFLAPTRAPFELHAALRLADAGVPTPELLAYAVYPAIGPFARADVVTRLLRGRALPEAWDAANTDDARWPMVEALSGLLAALRRAGAYHADLNVRNVIMQDSASGPTAAVLDVDRVVFGVPDDPGVATKNLRRLLRSMAKERADIGVDFTAPQLERLQRGAGAAT